MRDKSVLRVDDERMSAKVSAALDNLYYKKYEDFERVFDRERQVKGIDVIFIRDGVEYKCDEKAAVRWRNLQTFSFELSFIDRRGDIVDGWFVSDRCENNSYLLIWLDQNDDKETMEAALVMKDKIMRHLENLGWTKDKLMEKESQIRANDGIGINFGNIRKNGCKFAFSTKLVEKPVNVLLPREVLKGLAEDIFNCEVTE